MQRIRIGLIGLALGMAAVFAGADQAAAGTVHPEERAKTLNLLMREITIEFDKARLEDAVEFVRNFTGADIDVLWLDDEHSEGLDKDRAVTIDVSEITTLDLLERILSKTGTDFEENNWQLSPSGVFEMGPESRLNRKRSMQLYDVQDLLYEVPNFTAVPSLDLDQILQQSSGQGGGGGGGSIFADDDTGGSDARSEAELAQELIDLVITNIESEHWEDNGGDGASIRYYRGSLIVRAPDYIHRQLGAYSVPRAK